ncbi:MAG TPA: UDP-2,3-diacylglucosamine diphosphatase [Gammaproteobacteria bacterium]|nr:UDP-2,3-diacylglucosamine diphosphatase [Gammaproteobacteria bacterium]
MATLFISDLHLDAARPHITSLFLDLLAGAARRAESLYILGDFFEAWIGDDDPDPHPARVMAALADYHALGIPVYFMHGNRDFLIGSGFADKTGCQLLHEPTVLDLHGTPTLLLHGDSLCTDDAAYQQFRSMVRNPDWQRAFLAKPLTERRALAAQARAESRAQTAAKAADIMDANQDAVEDILRKYGVNRLIHGHTHRPAVHRFVSDGQPRTRIVLGDWYEQRSLLWVDADGVRLEDARVAAQAGTPL